MPRHCFRVLSYIKSNDPRLRATLQSRKFPKSVVPDTPPKAATARSHIAAMRGLRQIFGALKWAILAVSAPKHAVFRCSGVLFRRLFGAETPVRREFGTPLHISALVRRRNAVSVVHAETAVKDVSAGCAASARRTHGSARRSARRTLTETGSWDCFGVPNQARGNVSACRTMIVGTVRRADTGSWECFGVLNHDREDGTEVSYSIAAAIGSKQNT